MMTVVSSRGLTEADWLAFERAGRLLHGHPWVFAKTMAHNPHWYTLRKHWDDAEFVFAVETLRRYGYRHRYDGRWYVQLDVNDHFYWTMGNPIGTLDWGWERLNARGTTLINRKPLAGTGGVSVPYDVLAPVYQPASADLYRQALSLVPLDCGHVLEVGCGTGETLAHLPLASYVGIDPSAAMVRRFQDRWGRDDAPAVVTTTLRAFVAPEDTARYDAIVALFGTGSYLSDDELDRIPLLLRPGGRALVMFYAPDFAPSVYDAGGVLVPTRAVRPGYGRHVAIADYVAAIVEGPCLTK